jgi:hypothetical protein
MQTTTLSKRVKMIWGFSLHGWEDVMRFSLAIVGIFGLIVGLATWFVVKLQRVEIEQSRIELETYKVEAGEKIAASVAVGEKAQENAAIAIAETAKAKERAAELTFETEKLRKENLDLQLAVAPRVLLISTFGDQDALKQFSGLRVFISSVVDFEAGRFARQLFGVLKAAGWDVNPEITPLVSAMDGVSITYEMQGPIKSPTTGEVVGLDRNPRGEAAVNAIVEVLKGRHIESRSHGRPTTRTPGVERRPGIPPDAISVEIGMKPTMYFLEKQYPEIKVMRDEMEKMAEDARRLALERRSPPDQPAK